MSNEEQRKNVENLTQEATKEAAENGYRELVIRTGEATPDREQEKLDILGNIESVSNFLNKRIGEINPLKSHVIVNRENRKVGLKIDEKSPYNGNVIGELRVETEVQDWGINSGLSWEPEKLAQHIKMNRTAFSTKQEAMKLHSDLKNFRAKVNREIENSNDDRGNTKWLREQAVETNLPDAFTLYLPVFKGEEVQSINVEVNIDEQSYECILISPDLKDLIKETADAAINREIERIKSISEALVIIEQ